MNCCAASMQISMSQLGTGLFGCVQLHPADGGIADSLSNAEGSQVRLNDFDIVRGIGGIDKTALAATLAGVQHPPKLDSEYKLRDGPSWFEIGKVFAAVWHECGKPDGSKHLNVQLLRDRMMHQTLDGHVFSHIRRFVVVSCGQDSCVALPIGSYAGKGVSKRGLIESETQRHSIMYDKRQPDIDIDLRNRRKDAKELMHFLDEHRDSFGTVAPIIACVQNSARPLHRTELEQTVRLSGRLSHKSGLIRAWTNTWDSVLNCTNSIFREDDGGYVQFVSSTMSTFLRNFRIDGIDSSHATIARICKLAIEECTAKAEDGYTMGAGAAKFLGYAYDYAGYHATIAHATDRGLQCRILNVENLEDLEFVARKVRSCSIRRPSTCPTEPDWVML